MTVKLVLVSCLIATGCVSMAQRRVIQRPGRVPVFRASPPKAELPAALKQLIDGASSRRYSGTRTVEFRAGGKLDSHDEIAYRWGSRTRVEFPNGSKFAGQIIVEDEKERRHYFPDRNEIRVLPPRREEIMERIGNLAQLRPKNLTLGASEMVAGYRADQICVNDNQGRTLQRLWIEPRSGTLLKRQLFDRSGSLTGFFEYTQIDFNPKIDERMFTIDRPGAKLITQLELLKRLVKRHGMDLMVLPPSTGFRLEGSHTVTVEGKEVVVQNYLSNATRVTLFQVKGLVDLDPNKLTQQSRGDFASTSWKIGDNTLILVGAVDSSALGRLAATVGPGTAGGRN